jgi:hypothetical protein
VLVNWPIPNGDPKDNLPAAATTTSAAAPVPGARSSSTGDEAKSLGPEIETAVLAKGEYNRRFGAFRKHWTKVETALADKAEEMRGARFVGASELVGAIGVMFALGKAVDLAAFPGKSFGEFDEVCAVYLTPCKCPFCA